MPVVPCKCEVYGVQDRSALLHWSLIISPKYVCEHKRKLSCLPFVLSSAAVSALGLLRMYSQETFI